tara:strand:- start:115 stop:501 length:387 start_codon:yes stop_codon:yes gene_type:complete
MAIPSGSGTEVLCRGTAHALSSSATALRFDRNPVSAVGTNTVTVPANHIITLITMTFVEVAGNAETISMIIRDGTNDIYILDAHDLPANSTFILNEKIVLHPGDKLTVFCGSSANVDVHYSYIDQDWS